MKITEITEGFNERQSTDEDWGEFKSLVSRGARGVDNVTGGRLSAVGGATGRSAMRGLRRVGAKMGSGRLQGQLKMDKALMGVMKNYQRYLGQANLDQNYASLQNYLKALGIENPDLSENRAAILAKNKAYRDAPAKAKPVRLGKPVAPDVRNAKGFQGADQASQASKKLTRNQVAEIIRNNLEAAMKAGTLPKEIQKFLST